MNFGNLKTNFRFIIAGIIGLGMIKYIERYISSKLILTIIYIVSVLLIILGIIGIYSEFKNRKSKEVSQNNIKLKTTKTVKEKKEIEKKCREFEEALSDIEKDIKELEKNYNIENMKELKENFEFWNESLEEDKTRKEGEYGKIDDKELKAWKQNINDNLFRRSYG